MATTSTCKGNARNRRFRRPKRNRYSETKRFSALIPTAAGAERPTKQDSVASCPLTGYFLPRRSDRDKSRLLCLPKMRFSLSQLNLTADNYGLQMPCSGSSCRCSRCTRAVPGFAWLDPARCSLCSPWPRLQLAYFFSPLASIKNSILIRFGTREENRGMGLPRSQYLHKISGKLVPAKIIPNSRPLGAWIQQHVGAFMTVGQRAEEKPVAGRVT